MAQPWIRFDWWLTAAVSTAILFMIAFWVVQKAEESRRQIPHLGILPESECGIEQRPMSTLLPDRCRLAVVSVSFSDCAQSCRLLEGRLASLHRLYTPYPNVCFVIIRIVNAESPTPPQTLPASQSVGGQLVESACGVDFAARLTDRIGDRYDLGADRHDHLFLLIDANGAIRGVFDGLDSLSINVMKSRLRILLAPEGERRSDAATRQ